MKRINLCLEDRLYEKIASDANAKNIEVHRHVITLLERLYESDGVDYFAALKDLENEAAALSVGKEFVLSDLPSYTYSVASASNSGISASTVRATLGKMFNRRVAAGMLPNVQRAVDSDGNLKFLKKVSVFIKVP